jgi:hypothetical protein
MWLKSPLAAIVMAPKPPPTTTPTKVTGQGGVVCGGGCGCPDVRDRVYRCSCIVKSTTALMSRPKHKAQSQDSECYALWSPKKNDAPHLGLPMWLSKPRAAIVMAPKPPPTTTPTQINWTVGMVCGGGYRCPDVHDRVSRCTGMSWLQNEQQTNSKTNNELRTALCVRRRMLATLEARGGAPDGDGDTHTHTNKHTHTHTHPQPHKHMHTHAQTHTHTYRH